MADVVDKKMKQVSDGADPALHAASVLAHRAAAATTREKARKCAGHSPAVVRGGPPMANSDGHGDSEDAAHARRRKTGDFPTRLPDGPCRCRAVEKAQGEQAFPDEVTALREQLQARFGSADILSKNPRMHAILELVARVAPTAATVLIEGETGTGKELVAQAIHRVSSRGDGPLVAVNCAALPEALLANELFGHEAGAFTGASGRRPGRLELANGGTLFLDEIGDIPEAMQVALLRALQERCFERVGGVRSIAVDLRVVAATNRPLARLVRRRRFRADLYYRLNVFRLELPPLRERPEDIPLLAAHFAHKHARPGTPAPRLAPESLALLQAQRWPGNIRELENAIERACVTAGDGIILPEDLPLAQRDRPIAWPQEWIDLGRPLPQLLAEATAEVERRYLLRALTRSRGHLSRCAQLCGLSRRSIADKLARHQIDRAAFKKG